MVKEFKTQKSASVAIKIVSVDENGKVIAEESYTVRTRFKLHEAFHIAPLMELGTNPLEVFKNNSLAENKKLADRMIDAIDEICSAPREVIEGLDLTEMFEIISLVNLQKPTTKKRRSSAKSSRASTASTESKTG